jgi:hypothetical protein
LDFQRNRRAKGVLCRGLSGQKMKLFCTIHKILNPLRISIAVSALAFLPAYASSSSPGKADFALPIEKIDSDSGTILSFRVHETSDRLYVAGRAKAHQLRRPMHVDIELIGGDGRVVAQKTDPLDSSYHPRVSSGRHGYQSYIASFPLSEARQAAKIRVVYHENNHGNS